MLSFSLFSHLITHVWSDQMTYRRLEEGCFLLTGIRSTLLKTETQLGPDHRLCPSSRWTVAALMRTHLMDHRRKQDQKGQRNFLSFFFCLSAHPSFSLSFCLKVSPSVTRTLLSLIFLVNVQVLLCFQWLFKLDSADYLNLDLAFYFTICLACFASQFINCSFTHSFFILSASPQSANDCLLSLIQFLIKILLCWSCREIQAQQSPQERCAGTCSAYQSICIILLIIIGSSKQNAK